MTVVVVMHLARGAVALEQGVGHPGAARPVLVLVEQLPAGAVLGQQAGVVVVEPGGDAIDRLAEAAAEGVVGVLAEGGTVVDAAKVRRALISQGITNALFENPGQCRIITSHRVNICLKPLCFSDGLPADLIACVDNQVFE